MPDLTVTAASVVAGSGAIIERAYNFGETITAGQAVYLKSSDSKWWKMQHDGTAEESGSGVAKGIALNGGAANQPAAVQTAGQLTIGATVAAGVEYYASATAGGLAVVGDLGSADYVTVMCYGITTAIVVVNPVAFGVVLA